MTCILRDGQKTWQGDRDSEGHRDYKITWLVEADTTDGPNAVMQTPGLPAIGSAWDFDDDSDLWAWCRPEMVVRLHEHENGPHQWWTVEQTFSTRPLNRCNDDSIEDPLLEPQKISGGFIKYTEEAHKDRHGDPIKNSAHEQIRGPQVEFDKNRATVTIEQNVADLEIEIFGPMVDCVNRFWLWGLPPRCIKLSNAPWERCFHGQCQVFYKRTFTFDINVRKVEGKFSVSSILMVAAGTGYAVGDSLVFVGGTNNFNPAQLIVTSVSVTGAVVSADIVSAGEYTVVPSNPIVTTTSGAGSGATFAGTWTDAMVSGFDRDILDEGTKALHGYNNGREWAVLPFADGMEPDPENPNHFVRYKDAHGENARVILDGHGLPIDPTPDSGSGEGESEPGFIHVEKYDDADFLLLGIPTVF